MEKRYLTIAAALLIVAIVVVLFLTLRPKTQPQTTQVPQATPTPTAQETPKPKLFELNIKAKRLVSPQQSFQVTEGDEVLFKVTSDEAEEFHLHGYDLSKDLTPGETAELSFIANITGRFEFELEKSKTTLGALEVLPK